MDGSFLDSLDVFDITQEEADGYVDELRADDTEAITWYEENGLPRGLQCVEVHAYPTTREFLEEWCRERNVVIPDMKHLVWAECLLDSLIS